MEKRSPHAPKFVSQLLAWYQQHQRPLPWRQTADPYRIWLSEVILQQTRVAQGLPYYQRFVAQYPTVQALAAADEVAVLRLWQGLGYYTRARNLHACARYVVATFNGQFPDHYQALLQLPGIGPYTAAAIASIAFQAPVAVVDGNVYRVLARVFGLEEDITSPSGKRAFAQLAQSLVPAKEPGTYNQALMEFGALHCTPSLPQCTSCFWKAHCVAYQTKRQQQLPVKRKRLTLQHRYFYYFLIQVGDKIYMKRRTQADIWRGLYDFHLVVDDQYREPRHVTDDLVQVMRRHDLRIKQYRGVWEHALTHQRLHIRFFHVQATPPFVQDQASLLSARGLQGFTGQEIEQLPKPVVICNFLKRWGILKAKEGH